MESQQVLVGAPAVAPTASERTEKFSLFALTATVVGSMVGAGIFSSPRAFATATGPFGAIIAWTIAAGGMYTLARVFQALAERKPNLDAGVYATRRPDLVTIPGSCLHLAINYSRTAASAGRE